jgi:hypothetical protein
MRQPQQILNPNFGANYLQHVKAVCGSDLLAVCPGSNLAGSIFDNAESTAAWGNA